MYARKNNRASTAMESKRYNAALSKIGNSSVELLLNLFLDFLMENALRNPRQEIEAYTEEMSGEDDELTKGVMC
ncbi:MAG: hypothetical protein DSM106950_32115 [Stigonema ocellatum SAG 48.90 = DSM 106950]|nr:hypothetical protein [Stigonema ocellatum SAG 48.90 = DSM 106950]